MATVYEYKGVSYELPDGLTNEDALARIKKQLGGAEVPPQPPQPEPPARDAMSALRRAPGLAARAAISGVSAPINVAADFLSGAYNLGAGLLGSESRMPYLSQAQQRGLTQMGLPTPETGAERAAQAGMEGLIGGAGAAKAAPKLFGGDLVRQLPASAAAPLAAQPVAETVKEVTGSDLAALIAGVGVAGAVGSSAASLADAVATGKLKPFNRPTPPTMQDVQQRAQRSYRTVSDAGIKLNTTAANDLVGKIKTRLDAVDYLPENATEVANVLRKYDSIVERGDVAFSDVEQMRRLANNLLANQSKDIRRLGKEMVSGIDEYIAGLSPKDVTAGAKGIDQAVKAITSARKDWRDLSRATTLNDILDTAEARAARPTASESELIRTGFINLAANKEKMRLFTENERNAIRAVANGGSLDNFLTLVARFNPQRSQLVTGGIGAAGVTSPETLMYTIPAAAAGYGADRLQSMLRQRAANQAIGGLLSGQTPAPQPSMRPQGLLSTLLTQPPQE
jgi:hypothetical protein